MAMVMKRRRVIGYHSDYGSDSINLYKCGECQCYFPTIKSINEHLKPCVDTSSSNEVTCSKRSRIACFGEQKVKSLKSESVDPVDSCRCSNRKTECTINNQVFGENTSNEIPNKYVENFKRKNEYLSNNSNEVLSKNSPKTEETIDIPSKSFLDYYIEEIETSECLCPSIDVLFTTENNNNISTEVYRRRGYKDFEKSNCNILINSHSVKTKENLATGAHSVLKSLLSKPSTVIKTDGSESICKGIPSGILGESKCSQKSSGMFHLPDREIVFDNVNLERYCQNMEDNLLYKYDTLRWEIKLIHAASKEAFPHGLGEMAVRSSLMTTSTCSENVTSKTEMKNTVNEKYIDNVYNLSNQTLNSSNSLLYMRNEESGECIASSDISSANAENKAQMHMEINQSYEGKRQSVTGNVLKTHEKLNENIADRTYTSVSKKIVTQQGYEKSHDENNRISTSLPDKNGYMCWQAEQLFINNGNQSIFGSNENVRNEMKRSFPSEKSHANKQRNEVENETNGHKGKRIDFFLKSSIIEKENINIEGKSDREKCPINKESSTDRFKNILHKDSIYDGTLNACPGSTNLSDSVIYIKCEETGKCIASIDTLAILSEKVMDSQNEANQTEVRTNGINKGVSTNDRKGSLKVSIESKMHPVDVSIKNGTNLMQVNKISKEITYTKNKSLGRTGSVRGKRNEGSSEEAHARDERIKIISLYKPDRYSFRKRAVRSYGDDDFNEDLDDTNHSKLSRGIHKLSCTEVNLKETSYQNDHDYSLFCKFDHTFDDKSRSRQGKEKSLNSKKHDEFIVPDNNDRPRKMKTGGIQRVPSAKTRKQVSKDMVYRIVHINGNFFCQLCHSCFKQISCCKNHVLTKHSNFFNYQRGSEMYSCLICKDRFHSLYYLNTHLEQYHNIFKFICVKCDKTFNPCKYDYDHFKYCKNFVKYNGNEHLVCRDCGHIHNCMVYDNEEDLVKSFSSGSETIFSNLRNNQTKYYETNVTSSDMDTLSKVSSIENFNNITEGAVNVSKSKKEKSLSSNTKEDLHSDEEVCSSPDKKEISKPDIENVSNIEGRTKQDNKDPLKPDMNEQSKLDHNDHSSSETENKTKPDNNDHFNSNKERKSKHDEKELSCSDIEEISKCDDKDQSSCDLETELKRVDRDQSCSNMKMRSKHIDGDHYNSETKEKTNRDKNHHSKSGKEERSKCDGKISSGMATGGILEPSISKEHNNRINNDGDKSVNIEIVKGKFSEYWKGSSSKQGKENYSDVAFDGKMFFCLFCLKEFEDFPCCFTHVLFMHNMLSVFTCDICLETRQLRTAHISHMKKMHNLDSYFCGHCYMGFEDIDVKDEHMINCQNSTVKLPDRFDKYLCKKCFTVHVNVSEYWTASCAECELGYASISCAKNHFFMQHFPSWVILSSTHTVFRCHCGKNVLTKAELQLHLLTEHKSTGGTQIQKKIFHMETYPGLSDINYDSYFKAFAESDGKCVGCEHFHIIHSKEVKVNNSIGTTCRECNISFSANFCLKNHILNKHGYKNEVRQCVGCGLYCAGSAVLARHQKSNHILNQGKICKHTREDSNGIECQRSVCLLKCDKCEELHQHKFMMEELKLNDAKSPQEFKEERLKEDECKRLTCICHFCDLEVENRRLLVEHIKCFHEKITDKKGDFCQVCKKQIESNVYYSDHLKEEHCTFKFVEGEIFDDFSRNFSCLHCKETFSFAMDMQMHLRIKHFEKPLVARKHVKSEANKPTVIGQRNLHCPLCFKYCIKKKDKFFHINLHFRDSPRSRKREKLYVCDICGKTFKDTLLFKEHTTKHTGVRQYKCDICEKTFLHQSNFSTHKLVHREKKEECKECGMKFTLPHHLRAHMKRKHP